MSQRKQTLKKRQTSGTPTKVAHPSPSKQPIRSPFIASKFNGSNSKPNVSYGELQIVLQNIQQIRKKANHQIALLTADNQKLKDELSRSHQDFEELSNRLNRSTSRNDYETKIIEQLEAVENDKRQLIAEIKSKVKENSQLQSRNTQLMQEISQRDDSIRELESKVEEWGAKWKWAFGILAVDASRSQQLIWHVKNQCDSGIWSIFQQNSSLSQQLQLKTGRLDVLERQLSQLRQTSRHTATLLEKSMAQVSVLNSKNSQCEQELSLLRQKCLLAENELSSCIKDFKLRQLGYQNTIQSLQFKVSDTNKQKQLGIQDITIKVVRLQEQIHQRELALLEKEKHAEYEHIISEVCEQSQDYVQMLERLRYLQKFKAEHYGNVEKIQYLCKMLDY